MLFHSFVAESLIFCVFGLRAKPQLCPRIDIIHPSHGKSTLKNAIFRLNNSIMGVLGVLAILLFHAQDQSFISNYGRLEKCGWLAAGQLFQRQTYKFKTKIIPSQFFTNRRNQIIQFAKFCRDWVQSLPFSLFCGHFQTFQNSTQILLIQVCFIYQQAPRENSVSAVALKRANRFSFNTASKTRIRLDYTLIMSCSKIKRLKTPLRSRQSFKSPDSTLLSLGDLTEESTISLIKTGNWSESIQTALITQINKLYKEIASVRQNSKRNEDYIEELSHCKLQLEEKVQDLKAEVAQLKQVYELQLFNHQQLRKFYEQRQLEWVMIVTEHRKMLEQYDQLNGTSLSQVQQISLNTQINDFLYQKTQVAQNNPVQTVYPELKVEKSNCKVEGKLVKALSIERSSPSLQKIKSKASSKVNNEAYYYNQRSRLYGQQNKFALKSKKSSNNLNFVEGKHKNVHRDIEIDQFFDQIIRKTYYKYKQKCISVGEIESMEDMVKLKNANTSTRERLTKTVKKLNFDIQNDQEFRLFCEYVEKAVIERYQALRGDFVFNLLIEKLKQCEKLALSSDSQLNRLDKQKSNIQDSMIAFEAPKNHNSSSRFQVSNLALSSKNNSVIEKASPKNVQLLVHSSIKPISKPESHINVSSIELKSKHSLSSERDLSELIQGGSFASNPEQNYFKFGKLKRNQTSQCFPQ